MNSQDAKMDLASRKYLVALGSNLAGDLTSPVEVLERALSLFAQSDLRITSRSRWYRSPAFPAGTGPEYVNGVVALTTTATPEAVLVDLHKIENRLGRVRNRRWEARVCDIDILACDKLVLPDRQNASAWVYLAKDEQGIKAPNQLILPHPRMQDRGFVLLPLAEIAAGWVHPILGKSVGQMLADLPTEALAGVEPLVA